MIIGIAGKAGSGKDLVGNIIQYLTACKKYEGMDCFKADYVNKGFDLKADYTNISNWEIKKFADKLKECVCLILGCTRNQLEDRDFKEKELGKEWEIPLQEEWKCVIGYEGLYKVSNFGRIKSLNRLDSMGRIVEETIKSQHIGTTGYPAITLNKEGKKKTKAVHQLVAESFLNHVPDNYNGVVNHLDNIKTNNRLDNLEVVSSRYNTQYSKSTEGIYERRGKFEVYIRISGKKTYLGSYITKEEALEVRNTKLQEIDTFIPLRYKAKQWTPRLLLQVMGTQIGRDIIHPNIWRNALFADYISPNLVKGKAIRTGNNYTITSGINAGKVVPYEDYQYNLDNSIYPNWIITDVRFPNELKAIKDRGGICIRVERHNHPNDTNPNTEHESESALDNAKFDYIIENNGTIEELLNKVKKILINEKII